MEKTRLPSPPERTPGYGPAAGAGRSAEPLSRSRAALLETLRAQGEPTSLAALAALSALHINTVREHLDALVRAGLARRHPEAPVGRGRPAWLYEATSTDVAAATEYAGLAAVLAAAIHRTSASPADDARDAGDEWGRELAHRRGARPGPSALAARREVVSLLDEIGFAPQADADSSVVRLTRCPLLAAAHKYPDIVCGVHLGLVQAALEQYGAPAEGAELVPFAEPGACLLQLTRTVR